MIMLEKVAFRLQSIETQYAETWAPVNELYLYSAFLVVMTTQSAFTLRLILPFTHIHTLMAGATTQGSQLTHQEETHHSYTVGTATGAILGLSVA